jgi:hypothetical protein
MGLKKIAESLDATLRSAGQHIDANQARIIESDERKMAHHIMAYVLERSGAGTSPFDLGAAMVQGAHIGEDESGGALAQPVITFLEEILDGAKSAIVERYGSDNITYDPVKHAVQYYCAHGKWPNDTTPGIVAKARAALAAGQRGQGGAKNAAFGTYL